MFNNTHPRTHSASKHMHGHRHLKNMPVYIHKNTNIADVALVEPFALLLLLLGVEKSSYEHTATDQDDTHHQKHHLLPCAQ